LSEEKNVPVIASKEGLEDALEAQARNIDNGIVDVDLDDAIEEYEEWRGKKPELLKDPEKEKKQKKKAVTEVGKGGEYDLESDYLIYDLSYVETGLEELLNTRENIYFDEDCEWGIWNKERKCWEKTDQTGVLMAVNRNIQWQRTDPEGNRGPFFPNEYNSKNQSIVLNALKQAARERKPKEFPTNWINTQSGIYDLETGKMFEATPEYFSVNPIPWKIGEKIETPNIDKLLADWVGKKKVPDLKERMAHTLIAYYRVQRITWLYGIGHNGKSKFIDIITKLIGIHNIHSGGIKLLAKNQFASAFYYDKLALFINETNITTIDSTAELKKLTGNDPIRVERKGGKARIDYNKAKIIIATNQIPPTLDASHGWGRRMDVFKFPNIFTTEADVLKNIPEKEYENLLAQLLPIAKKLWENGQYTNELPPEKRGELYTTLSCSITAFIEKNYVLTKNPDDKIRKTEFTLGIAEYTKKNNMTLLSTKMENRALRGLGLSIEKEYQKEYYQDDGELISSKTVSFIYGMRRKTEEELEEETQKKLIEGGNANR